MTQTNEKRKIVFSVYPNANGFGFVYMENARKLLDYGAVRINPISNRKVLVFIPEHLTPLFLRFDPYVDKYGLSWVSR